jgi:RimJ/RimL family protein N-acetyltransferase
LNGDTLLSSLLCYLVEGGENTMRFYGEKDLAVCGLACVLCSNEDCPGCKARGCKGGEGCSVFKCAMAKGIDGCYQCAEFPCGEDMLKGIRIRAFNRYARQHGKQALLERLRINFASGVTYHRPGGLRGDYDLLATEDEILRLIQFGSLDPYAQCPVLATEHFILRLVRVEDAEDLLQCYADPRAQEVFNADDCTSDFRYQTLAEMQNCIRFWLGEYEDQAYVRFAVVDKACARAVGTIEMFGMIGKYRTLRGALRLDIASAFEGEPLLCELFSLCVDDFYALFAVEQIVTKALPAAEERIAALRSIGFTPFAWPEPGLEHYWLREKG